MGRGLSRLQRHILKRAAQLDRVYYADILMDFYGFPTTWPCCWAAQAHKCFRRLKSGGGDTARPSPLLVGPCIDWMIVGWLLLFAALTRIGPGSKSLTPAERSLLT